MRNKHDNYIDIALLGNNLYDINFMKHLFLSQNVRPYYCSKYKVDEQNDIVLRNMAYYFGSKGPLLIDNKGLDKIFIDNGIPKVSQMLNLSSDDIIEQIENSLKCDAVYVCNNKGNLDKYTMFILGYLMAMEQEIFFWNEIEGEFLMSCISKNNNNGYKEVVQFPLEIIRTLAYPYLFKKYKGKLQLKDEEIFVSRNTEFNLNVKKRKCRKNTISLLGSLRKQLESIKENAQLLEEKGYTILAPKLSDIKTDLNGFIIFEEDISDNPIKIESDFIENCLKSQKIIVCDKDGYIGNTVMFEIGYLLAKNKKIKFIEKPNDKWLIEVMKYFSKTNDKQLLKK